VRESPAWQALEFAGCRSRRRSAHSDRHFIVSRTYWWNKFTLVATNVPYLGRAKQDDALRDYCEQAYPASKADLATCMLERLFNCALTEALSPLFRLRRGYI